MTADIHTRRTTGANGGGILVRQFSQTVPFTWSVWVDGVCHGCPRVWVTRNLNSDSRYCGWFSIIPPCDGPTDHWPAGTTGQVRVYTQKPFDLTLTPTMVFASRSPAGAFRNYWLQAHGTNTHDLHGGGTDTWREELRPLAPLRWPEFFKMARAARHNRDGRGLLDWLREYGVDALPILGKLMDVEPIVREADPAESGEQVGDVAGDVLDADGMRRGQE